jgi:PAS domain S-box-containing protein
MPQRLPEATGPGLSSGAPANAPDLARENELLRAEVVRLTRLVGAIKQAEEALRKSESRLAEAQRLAQLGSWEWDAVTNRVTWSAELYRIFGLQPEQLSATYEGFLERVHPDDRDRVQQIVDRAYLDHRPFEYDCRTCRPDGVVRNLHARGHVEVDAHGRTLRMIGTAQDVTEQVRLAAELRLLETLPRQLLDAPDQVSALRIAVRAVCEAIQCPFGQAWAESPDGAALECTPAWHASRPSLQAFRAASEALRLPVGSGLIGRVWSAKRILRIRDLTADPGFLRAHDAQAAGLRAALAVPVLVGSDLVAVLEFFTTEAVFDSDRLSDLVSAVATELGDALRRQRAEKDRARLFAEVQESQAQLRALTARAERVREEERAFFAREIHDELGQELTALKMDIAGIERRLRAGATEEAVAHVLAKAAEMKSAIDAAIEAVRQLASKLRPALLDDLGLTAAVAWLLQEFERRTGFRCRVRARIDDSQLGWDVSTAAFRILQEALTNVARHAGARRVAVSLTARKGRLALDVRDDGKGIEPSRMLSRDSLGILGMRERASRLGGELRIERGRRGTTVRVSLPLPRPERAQR